MCDMGAFVAHENDVQEAAIETLRNIEGLGKGFVVLSATDKEKITSMKEKENMTNIGVRDTLLRDITIAFSHNDEFRKPPCAIVLLSHKGKIVGEMADSGKKFYNGTTDVDSYILPPVPFPELDGKFAGVCSASPGYEVDTYIRKLISVGKNDATLLIGLNLR